MFRIARTLMRTIKYGQKSPSWLSMQKFPYHSLFINPPVDEVPTLTTTKIAEIFAKEIGQAAEYSVAGLHETAQTRMALMDLLPKPEDVLPLRKMEESFVSAIVPLKSQPEIRERYVSAVGGIRIGRILEELDVFCVYVCFKHILNPRSVGKQNPYSVVTAMVDSIHIVTDVLKSNEDIRMSGHVTYTGRTSMEVCVIVDQKDENGVYQKNFDAVFLMVARDPLNTGSARINSLAASTPEEKEFLKKGESRQSARKKEEEHHILKEPPLKEEMKIVHDGFLERRKNYQTINSNSKKMADTVMRTLIICQPENRNRYNKIFGGFIMRQAYELAFTSTYIFGRRRPRIINIDNIKFELPVDIGSIFRLRSYIGYVENDYVHTVVVCHIIDPHTGIKHRSNELHFTFLMPTNKEASGSGSDEPVPELEFETYREAMNYINSRRHYRRMMEDHNFKKSQALLQPK